MKTNPQIKQEINTAKIISLVCNFSIFHHEFHWHQNVEIIQILDQKCSFLIDGTFIEAAEGDIVTIGENIVHQFIDTQSNARVRILQFSLKNFLDAGIPIHPVKIHISADEIDKIPQLRQMLDAMFETIDREGQLDDVKENYFQKSVLNSLYCLLTRHFTEEASPGSQKEQQDFRKILNYINEHFEEDLNINILSEHLLIDRRRISAIFHKYSGMTASEYIYSLRIKKANDLIKQGCSVTDVAMQSGFQSIRTFNNIYKKVTGITPMEYKKGAPIGAKNF